MTEALKHLPVVRGRYVFDHRLSEATWFRVGGAADVIFKPKDINDLAAFLKEKPQTLPVVCLGAGSNVLVRDAGVRGCVIRLTRGFSEITFEKDHVIAGAGCLDRTFVLACQQQGVTGLEFLVGIPGTIGGAVAMNAGAYDGEVKDFIEWVEVVTPEGEIERLSGASLHMSYRKGNLPAGVIAVRAAFRKHKGDPLMIQNKIDSFLQKREETQPIRGRTGGSTFKNPLHQKAWQLIDAAGCRGLRVGDAQVSEKHCNFLLNLDAASAHDLEALGETVRARVLTLTGVALEWEIIRLGDSVYEQVTEKKAA